METTTNATAVVDRNELLTSLYTQYQKLVFNTCLRMTKNVPDAEDFTQRTFLVLAQQLEQFRGESKWSSYICRIAINEVLMHFRKSSTKRERDGIVVDDLNTFHSTNPNDRIMSKLIVDETISKMPPGYARTLVLHDIEGHEHQEISALLSISSGTSKSQLHKARKRFKFLADNKKERNQKVA